MKTPAKNGVRRPRRLGKYRLEKRIAEGGFAAVYKALDTIEGIRVALKVVRGFEANPSLLEVFRQEVRVAGRLEHPNILPIKDANVIDGHLLIVSRLGECSLADRLTSRLSRVKALEFAEQILSALAHAHERRVIHCDVKPENFILFDDGTLRLIDFGIARVALRTLHGSGSGTVGYVAPEQAMGRPSYRSDVFSAGLILCRMFSGHLPEWPFQWPPKGHDRLRKHLHPEFVEMLGRAISVTPGRRFKDCSTMLRAFHRLRGKALRDPARKRKVVRLTNGNGGKDWREVRWQQFSRQFGRALAPRHACQSCCGPVAETMVHCPWCGRDLRVHKGETPMPRRCPRCRRGMKADWRYCAWCYGAGVPPKSDRTYTDKRYTGRCANRSCDRRELMPFMRYCPWCRTKVRKPWPLAGTSSRCPSCRWGVAREFWRHCPWCSKKLET